MIDTAYIRNGRGSQFVPTRFMWRNKCMIGRHSFGKGSLYYQIT